MILRTSMFCLIGLVLPLLFWNSGSLHAQTYVFASGLSPTPVNFYRFEPAVSVFEPIVIDQSSLTRRSVLRDGMNVLLYEEDSFGGGRLVRYSASGKVLGTVFEVDPWTSSSNSQVENDVHGNIYVARFQSSFFPSDRYRLRRYDPSGALTLELDIPNLAAVDADASGRMFALRRVGAENTALRILDPQGKMIEEHVYEVFPPADVTYDDVNNRLYMVQFFGDVVTLDLNFSPPTVTQWSGIISNITFGISLDDDNDLVLLSGVGGTYRYTRDGTFVDRLFRPFGGSDGHADAITIVIPEPSTSLAVGWIFCLVWVARRCR